MMKKTILLAGLLAAACTAEPLPDETSQNPGGNSSARVFEAFIEGGETKTYLDGNKVLWTAGDGISVFDRNDGNLEYAFQGKTGDASGKFTMVGGETGAVTLDYVYAVYPYQESFSVQEGLIKANWNSNQNYVASSFGLGENLMTAVSESNILSFKNAGSCLKLRLTGDGVIVKKIRLYGNSGEKLAGPADVTVALGEAPSAVMTDGAVGTVTLNCGDDGVALTSDVKDFCFALPPVSFNSGLTVEVIDDAGDVFTKTTSKKITLERNVLNAMTAFSVEMAPSLKRGSGTASDPYLIGTVKELLTLSSLTNSTTSTFLSKCYKMDADIDMSSVDNFTPIAMPSGAAFSGTFDGDNHKITNLSISGTKTAAGLFSHVNGATIKNINIASATYSASQNSVGGIAGRVDGKETLIRDCIFQGEIRGDASSYRVGGIVGTMTAGVIKGCVLGSKGIVYSESYGVGGIVGEAVCNKYTDANSLEITNSAAYGTVKGKYCVGGIAGTFQANSGYSGRVINCASIATTVVATGYDSSNRALVGGILGMTKGAGSVQVVNSYSRPYLLKDTDTATSVGCVGGITGGNYCTGTTNYIRCYSTIDPAGIYKGSKKASESYSGTCHFGAILGRTYSTGTCTASYCYYVTDIAMYTGDNCSATNCEQLTPAQMCNGTLLAKLNAASSTVWMADSENYPTLASGVIPDDPTPGSQKTRKRVSVIGDSISTWTGWVPSDYKCHYPSSTGNEPPTKVSQSWWWQVIYKYMTNAVFDTNLAYSGTNLADIPQEIFDQWVIDHPTSKTDWYGNDMIQRFVDQDGLGDPNVILIFGGTNDWNHNCGYLVGTKKLRLTTAVSASLMEDCFTRADAATTYAKAKALESSTFADGYCKLIRLIHTKYPDCKVVMLVPYYGGVGMESVINQIADHYSSFCRSVDLFAVNGFQDVGLWDYAGGTWPSGTYTQPHMPTHDFNSSTGHGAHLNITGMAYVSNKIYTELKDFLND